MQGYMVMLAGAARLPGVRLTRDGSWQVLKRSGALRAGLPRRSASEDEKTPRAGTGRQWALAPTKGQGAQPGQCTLLNGEL